MSASIICTPRLGRCADCAAEGWLVDTTAGEVVGSNGQVIAAVPTGSPLPLLLVSAYQPRESVCDACEGAREAAVEVADETETAGQEADAAHWIEGQP